MSESLIHAFQRHLIEALYARVQATEQAIGRQYGFEFVWTEYSTAFIAHGWPAVRHSLPIHRVFFYRAPKSTQKDSLLDRLSDEDIDPIIEVTPGPHEDAAAKLLSHYGYRPVWRIPWYHLSTTDLINPRPYPSSVEAVVSTKLSEFARVLSTAYGYEGPEREAWHAFSQYGYRAPGFTCFLAHVEGQSAAAGVMHLAQQSALVDGAATLKPYRGMGLQKALLAARLWHAGRQGAKDTFSRTGMGSISQANLEKVGMKILTESTAWRRA